MSGHYLDVQVGGLRARMASGRVGAAAGELWERALARGRTVKDPQALVPTLSGYARFLLEHGRPDEAVPLLEEMNELSAYFAALIDLGWVLHALDRPELMRSEARGGVWSDAGALIARGELAAAADLLGEKGLHTEEAYARLRAAEALTGAARADAARTCSRVLPLGRRGLATCAVRRRSSPRLRKSGVYVPQRRNSTVCAPRFCQSWMPPWRTGRASTPLAARTLAAIAARAPVLQIVTTGFSPKQSLHTRSSRYGMLRVPAM